MWILALQLACSANPANAPGGGATIVVDGSSTVFPISEAVAEDYGGRHPSHRVTVGVSGTGGGMKKLCNGEVAIAGASRPIKPSEMEACATNGVSWLEIPIAYDGIAVVVHPSNDWVGALGVAELKRMWEPAAQGQVLRWSDVRPGWPDAELHLFGAGVDSGTYDYFTAAIVGKEHSSRGDFTSSEDDNTLVQGIRNDRHALGFLGLAYFEANASLLQAVPVDDGVDTNGAGPVLPSARTVADGTYQPLSRPIFLYANAAALAHPATASFLDFYVTAGASLVGDVGYIPLSPAARAAVKARLDARVPGSLFAGRGSTVGATLEALLGVSP
jgi:phosphate transport system substrate-binding protein